jgi:predicted transcriptional regulator
MITVRQLGNRLKVSHVTLYSQIKKPEFRGHTFKDAAGITQIDDVGQALLEARYLQAQEETIKDIVSDELSQVKGDLSDDKEGLKINNTNLLALLQRQIETKDEQINNLLRIISNQQQIQITHFLTDKHRTAAQNDGPIDAPVTTKPPPWYRRLFSRR